VKAIADDNQELPRIAASSYLNSAPLIWSFSRGKNRDRVILSDDVPANCALLLSQGKVDAALVPVIEYQRIPNLSIAPDVCVGSRNKVRSVVLVSRLTELSDIRSVALDESSRTSAALVKIIFREFLHTEPTWKTANPNIRQMLSENDAALIIGDPAMTFDRSELQVWDLASVWRQHTGLGFVFAMWMISPSRTARFTKEYFASARDEGLACVEDIISAFESLIPLSRADMRTYLTENITFNVADDMQAGMQLYFDLAGKHELIENVRPLRLLGSDAV